MHYAKYEHALTKMREPNKKSLYAALFKKRGEDRGYNYLDDMVKPVIADIDERRAQANSNETSRAMKEFMEKVCIQVRLQEIRVSLYENA